MDYIRKIFFCFLIFYSGTFSIAQNLSDTALAKTGGLKFASKDVYSAQRTSLILFDDFQHVPRSFNLKFTCDIYDTRHYGFVFRIMHDFQTNVAPIMHLIYVPPQGTSLNCSFEFHFYQSKNTLTFELDTLDLKDIAFNVRASVRDNLIRIECNGEHKETTFDFPRAMNINFLFGLHGENTDVAPMVLHNISLNLNDQLRYFWPLNEFSGNFAIDRIEKIRSRTMNAIWLQDRHYYWEKLKDFRTDPMAGIIMDRQNNILIINKDSMVTFNPAQNRISVNKYAEPRPFDRNAFFSVYNPKSRNVIGYDFHFLRTIDGMRVYSVFEPQTNTWSKIDSSDIVDQNHHHSVFWNRDTTRLITFGGYSYFRYYNTFRAFNFDSAKWDVIDFSGDEVYPRTHTAISRNRYTGKYYLYGGFGNREGSQSLEGRYFYDLYEISPETRTIKRIWDMNNSDFDFVPRGNLIFNPDAPVCYVLGNPPVEKSNLRLYQINLEKPEIHIVSDSIPVIFSDMAANAFLFHNSERNELYCVTRETTNNAYGVTTIYRLNYPPAGKSDIILLEKKTSFPFLIVPILLLAIFAAVVLYLLVKKKKKNKGIYREQNMKSTGNFERTSKNAIWLLNEFRVFDRDGHDITYRFATKIRHAFIVLFFEEHFNNGISSDDFSNLLWPSLNKNQQKNNRGVIMNNLRKIFEDLPDVKLVKENLRWKLRFEQAIYVDFLEIHNILKRQVRGQNTELILNYFSLGNILNNENWEYLDQFKERYSSAAVDMLLDMNQAAFHAQNYLECIEISDIVLSGFDFLNEPALIIKIKSLYLLKNSSKAMSEYNKFRLRYNESISKPFHLSFDDILKTTLPTENY